MTNLTDFQRKISTFFPTDILRFEEPLAKHTSFRIGGNAEVMAFPKSREDFLKLFNVSVLLDTKPVILGAGTNVLAPDDGVQGLVICTKDSLSGMEQIDETHIRVMAGVTMSRAAVFAAEHGLSGLEFAHGIPGTVGGGIYMNAGAYGGEISQVCQWVELVNCQGEVITRSREEMDFSYRHSVLEGSSWYVVSAVFALTPRPKAEIRDEMKQLVQKRMASQPLEYPSAGSAFKRPASGYAAALIDGAGLKGFQVGGAAVSTKHAGFVVNLGGATAGDVTSLLKQVSDRVFEQTGIRLEPEIRIWSC